MERAFRRILACMVVLGGALIACIGGHAFPQDKGPVVPPNAKLEKIFDKGLVLTEGVAVAPDGMVYFSDITFTHVCQGQEGAAGGGHIWKFDPTTRQATIFRSPSGMSNGSSSTPTAT